MRKATARSTSTSGVEAPEDSPITSAPSIHNGSMELSSEIRWEGVPASRPTSTSRLEFDEFGEPTMKTTSERPASALTASWRFWLA